MQHHTSLCAARTGTAEGGVRIPPAGYLAGARALCDEFDALLIADEIHSGLGRLGSWWGCDEEGVRPDVLTAGKILSGGVVPVAATLATAEVFDVLSLTVTRCCIRRPTAAVA